MADNAFVKIGTALLKHQVKKLVGEEAMGAIGQELAEIGGDKLDAWLGDQSTLAEIEKAARTAHDLFRGKVNDNELEQWMVSLPLGNLPKVVKALEELPNSPDETKLESALRESIALNWKGLSPAQVDNTVNAFLSALRSALLPIEKQTLLVIGRSVLRTEDKVDLLIRWFEQYIITGKTVEIKQPSPEPVDYWYLAHPYPMPPNFTGRVEERKMLADWLNKDNENRLFILRALGGFGKSALTWHWLTHDVDPNEWKKVIFWSFYEGDASFEHFSEETLKYLKLEVPQGQRPQVDALLHAMQSQKILLIMDGFERALRAYSSMNAAYQGDETEESPSPASGRGDRGEGGLDCVNINAEIFLKHLCSLPNIKSKVLMTTRLTPRAVKPRGEHVLGCREAELTSMQPADAVEFFHRQKIKGTHAEIEVACASYGYHPLSLRLLAGRILKDFENPADIVVAQKLKIDGDIVQQKHHVLEVSYNNLPLQEQRLLSTIACFRSPVDLKTLEAITENKISLNDDLHDLVARGLLHFDEKSKKFDLHPIVRRYSYERLTAADRTVAHTRLSDYFTGVDIFTEPQALGDLAPVIELYHHLLQGGDLFNARKLYDDRIRRGLYFQFGAYQTIIELLRTLLSSEENFLPKLHEDTAWTLNELGKAYGMNGQPLQAIELLKRSLSIRNNLGHKLEAARILSNLANRYLELGRLKDSISALKSSEELCKETQNEFLLAIIHRQLGRVMSYCGMWQEAAHELNQSNEVFLEKGAAQPRSALYSYLAHYEILRRRDLAITRASKSLHSFSPLDFALMSLRTDEKVAAKRHPYKRDVIRTHWILGAAYLFDNKHTNAENYLDRALIMSRSNNNVEIEGRILIDFSCLRYKQNNHLEAKSLADEALTITERCGYVLQGADVNLFLAQYALEQEKDKAKAKAYAEEALKLATCDGPPYYYKVAYEEAEALLKRLG